MGDSMRHLSLTLAAAVVLGAVGAVGSPMAEAAGERTTFKVGRSCRFW